MWASVATWPRKPWIHPPILAKKGIFFVRNQPWSSFLSLSQWYVMYRKRINETLSLRCVVILSTYLSDIKTSYCLFAFLPIPHFSLEHNANTASKPILIKLLLKHTKFKTNIFTSLLRRKPEYNKGTTFLITWQWK